MFDYWVKRFATLKKLIFYVFSDIIQCICSVSASASRASTAQTGNVSHHEIHPALQFNPNPRKSLPADQIYGGAISLWDIAKRQLPIHAFEPLSILQASGGI